MQPAFEPQEGVIALLDILGSKTSWARLQPKSFLGAWKELVNVLNEKIMTDAVALAGRLYGQATTANFNASIFSDTLIFTATGKRPEDLLDIMVKIIMETFNVGMLTGIYFRGAISTGYFYTAKSLVTGPAVEEVAEWYELADWIGVSTAPSATFLIESIVEGGNTRILNSFVKYDIPRKDGSFEKQGWALAWPLLGFKSVDMDTGEMLEGRKFLMKSFANKSLSINVYPKFRNTLNFYDYVMKSKEKRS